ncbi:hypothetical protein HA1_02792 [Clostridium perfringens F262]|uniref:Uncharacterized protein n=1 Tax=Clostridium perfringens F262 TaxID=883064 RepID=A0AAV3FFG7_CLOPF|nr:hypothetical protein HA1_02792 [Clostridium perfringens F262]
MLIYNICNEFSKSKKNKRRTSTDVKNILKEAKNK